MRPHADLTPFTRKKFTPVAEALDGVKLVCNWADRWQFDTVAGPLVLTVYSDWIPGRFEFPARALDAFKNMTLASVAQERLNKYSGKWNYHWFEFMPHKTKWTMANKKLGIAFMVGAIYRDIFELLPANEPAGGA